MNRVSFCNRASCLFSEDGQRVSHDVVHNPASRGISAIEVVSHVSDCSLSELGILLIIRAACLVVYWRMRKNKGSDVVRALTDEATEAILDERYLLLCGNRRFQIFQRQHFKCLSVLCKYETIWRRHDQITSALDSHRMERFVNGS